MTSHLPIDSRGGRQRASWLLGLVIFVLAAVPRLWQLDYFLMVDENLWYQRSAQFLHGLVHGQLAQTAQTGHPGVTTMWSGSIGLLLYYLQAGLPGEGLAQFADRMLATPATLDILRWLRLPLAVLSALSVAVAFGLTQRLLGRRAALIGALLMAFEPFFLGHSRVLHHDSPTAAFSLLAVLTWLLYLKERQRAWLVLAGAGVALATLSKISSIFLLGFAGLTLLPTLWQGRGSFWRGLPRLASPWLQLAGVVILVVVLAWPALWDAPLDTLRLVYGFIDEEKGPHENGTFFMGQPVPDAGPLYYPVSLSFVMSPVTLIGLGLAVIGLALAWMRARRASRGQVHDQPDVPWAAWLLGYALLFVIYMSLIAKKQERYVLPAVVTFDLVAGWGWTTIIALFPGFRRYVDNAAAGARPSARLAGHALPVLVCIAQLAMAWSSAPYYSTFYNPLLGGGEQAQKVILVGRGEGLEQAVRYIQAHADQPVRRVASWYGTTTTVLFEDQVEVSDVAHPQYILGSDYIIFYVNQLQRLLPDTGIIRYVRRQPPVHTVRLSGIDYAYVYRGKAISHPVDPYADYNYLVGRARLTGFDISDAPAAGESISLRLFWVNDGMPADEHFRVRLTDALNQPWGQGECVTDPAFDEPASWQDDDIIESQCQLQVLPGTPPGDYLLRLDLVARDGRLIGQLYPSPEEGSLAVTRPTSYLTDDQLVVEHRVDWPLPDGLTLVGYDVESGEYRPAESVPLVLYWRAARAPAQVHTVRLSLAGAGTGQYMEWTGQPVNGRYPTSAWQAGELVRDPWSLSLPPSLPGGEYQLKLQIADTDGRLSDALILAQLSIQGRAHAFSLPRRPQHAQTARLGEAIRFLGYDLTGGLDGDRLQPGQSLEVTLFWQAEAPPDRNYVVFVQLLDSADRVRAQHDGQPGSDTLITTTWAAGEYVLDTHRLNLPPALAADQYRLIVGMYLPDTLERLPVYDIVSGQPLGDHITLNTSLRVP